MSGDAQITTRFSSGSGVFILIHCRNSLESLRPLSCLRMEGPAKQSLCLMTKDLAFEISAPMFRITGRWYGKAVRTLASRGQRAWVPLSR